MAFGAGEDCGLRCDDRRASAVPPLHALLTLERGVPIIHDRSGKRQLQVNGLRQSEAALQDGDLIQLGEGGPQIRLRLVADRPPPAKPLLAIMEDSREIVVRTPHRR